MTTRTTSRRVRTASRGAFLSLSAAAVILVAVSCGDNKGDAEKVPTQVPLATATLVPGAEGRATLSGTLTLDGAPLEAEFLGARVVRDGLSAACQLTIPPVTGGRYEIDVASDAEVRGCGAPGAEVLLWAFTDDAFFFTSELLPWPGNGAPSTFDASFSSDAREGASKPVTEFKGHLYDRDGRELRGGTVIEAYAGDTRCAVTSLRYGYEVEGFYTLIVAGPENVAGCAQGATLTFRLDGAPAVETAFNDLATGSEGHELNLTLQ